MLFILCEQLLFLKFPCFFSFLLSSSLLSSRSGWWNLIFRSWATCWDVGSEWTRGLHPFYILLSTFCFHPIPFMAVSTFLSFYMFIELVYCIVIVVFQANEGYFSDWSICEFEGNLSALCAAAQYSRVSVNNMTSCYQLWCWGYNNRQWKDDSWKLNSVAAISTFLFSK